MRGSSYDNNVYVARETKRRVGTHAEGQNYYQCAYLSKSVKVLRRILGLFNCLLPFISNFARKTQYFNVRKNISKYLKIFCKKLLSGLGMRIIIDAFNQSFYIISL